MKHAGSSIMLWGGLSAEETGKLASNDDAKGKNTLEEKQLEATRDKNVCLHVQL